MNTARNNTDVHTNMFIPIITGIILWVHFLFLCLPVYANPEETYMIKSKEQNIMKQLPGKIIIDIYDDTLFSSAYYDITIVPEKDLTIIKSSKEINNEFQNIYQKEKLYRNELKQEDFIKWKKLWDLVGEKYKQHYWPKSNNMIYELFFQSRTRPNRQLSHTIIYSISASFHSNAALIDLGTMSIVDYFVNAGECVWDKKGDLFALEITDYSKGHARPKYMNFIVYDLTKKKEIFQGKLEKDYPDQMVRIVDFAWSSDSRFVAVLAQTAATLYWPPHNFLLDISGHGRYEMQNHLSIFDLHGNLVYSKRIEGTYISRKAQMLWLE